MRIACAVAGAAVLAAAGCQLSSAPASSAPAVPAAPPATVYVTATPPAAGEVTAAAPPAIDGLVHVPDLARRRLDVAEYMLNEQGLGHSVIGNQFADSDADEFYVCATQPRADTTVRSGTRVALIVEEFGC